jgi:hypothetical protein
MSRTNTPVGEAGNLSLKIKEAMIATAAPYD